MLFNSLIFTLFLPVVFIVFWILPQKSKNYFLLAASYYFYFSYNPWFLFLLLGTSSLDFWCGQKIQTSEKNKKVFLWLSIVSNLLVLISFKYLPPITLNFLTEQNETYNFFKAIIIPAGLSFYTFQSLSYCIDLYRGKYVAKESYLDFLLFVSFFPHMVAGPIVRYNDLMPQLKATKFFSSINWESAVKLIIWGYFKKLVIADNLNSIVSSTFNHVTTFNGIELLAAGFLFVIQVYCDFSGYSDIAIGVAKLFKIDLAINWCRPLLSKSVHEFWRRNHISITNWFREYVFFSLGGSRVPFNRFLINIFIVFIVSSVWHGSSFTFVVWGLFHAVFFIFEILISKKFPNYKAPKPLGWLYLISIHTISLIAFRANSFKDLLHIYSTILKFKPNYFSFTNFLTYENSFYYAVCGFAILIMVVKELQEEFTLISSSKKIYGALNSAFYVSIILLIFILGNFSANTFIYFQF